MLALFERESPLLVGLTLGAISPSLPPSSVSRDCILGHRLRFFQDDTIARFVLNAEVTYAMFSKRNEHRYVMDDKSDYIRAFLRFSISSSSNLNHSPLIRFSSYVLCNAASKASAKERIGNSFA